jgi:hypothetical protein
VPQRKRNFSAAGLTFITAVWASAPFRIRPRTIAADGEYYDAVIIFYVQRVRFFGSVADPYAFRRFSAPTFFLRPSADRITKTSESSRRRRYYVSNSESLINIAKNQKSEILFYEFSASMIFFYTLAGDKRFVYVRNLRHAIPIKKKSPVL